MDTLAHSLVLGGRFVNFAVSRSRRQFEFTRLLKLQLVVELELFFVQHVI